MRRITAAAGIVSALLIVVGIFLLVREQIDTLSDQEIVDYYADSGNRAAEITGFFMVIVGAALFLAFMSELRSRLQMAGPELTSWTRLAQHAGTAGAALLIAASVLFASVSFGVEFDSDFIVEANLARLGRGAGSLFLLGWVLVNIISVITTAVLALRTAILPSWLGWASVAIAPIAIAEAFLMPVFAIPVWVLAVSTVLVREPANTTAGN